MYKNTTPDTRTQERSEEKNETKWDAAFEHVLPAVGGGEVGIGGAWPVYRRGKGIVLPLRAHLTLHNCPSNCSK